MSFIPTLATMILGLLAGGVLRRTWPGRAKVLWLAVAAGIGLAAGWGLGELGLCPIVKRIWTPSWVLYSGGWCFLFLAAFYAVLDVVNVRFWAFPLRVIGMNSIAAYCMADVCRPFIAQNLTTHLGNHAVHGRRPALRAALAWRGRALGALADSLLDVPAQAVFADLIAGRPDHSARRRRRGGAVGPRLEARDQ